MTRGVKFGRPPKLSAEQIALIVRLADEGQTAPQIAETFGVHENNDLSMSGAGQNPYLVILFRCYSNPGR
jgi:hypothetical protein